MWWFFRMLFQSRGALDAAGGAPAPLTRQSQVGLSFLCTTDGGDIESQVGLDFIVET